MNLDIRFDFQRRERLDSLKHLGSRQEYRSIKESDWKCNSKNEVVFITRIDSDKAYDLLNLYDDARFYEEAKCLIIGKNLHKLNTNKKVAIISEVLVI